MATHKMLTQKIVSALSKISDIDRINGLEHGVFCDALGSVHVFRSWDEVISFQAHSSGAIRLCSITQGGESNLLVTLVAQHQDSMIAERCSNIHLQVFNLHKITKRNGAPCIGYSRMTTSSAATVMRAHLLNDGSQLCIAIGNERGDIQLYRAQLGRGDMSSGFRTYTVSMRAITGIEFWQRRDGIAACNMFICSDAGVFCYTLNDNNDEIGETKVVLDTIVAPTRCCTMHTTPGCLGDSYFIVGRDDALYCFTNEGRGPCYALEGHKRSIASFGNNLVALVEVGASSLSPKSGALTSLVIIDIHNKMIVMQREVDDLAIVLCVENVVNNNNYSCFIVTNTREVFVLRERDMKSKLRLLVAKNLYDIALRLIDDTAPYYNNNSTAGQIYLQYGDYLFLKGDVSSAVDKYIKTIGRAVEPYCVISKLLDSRYNRELAQYLDALTQTEYATSDHFDLLRNCIERLALPSRIKSNVDSCINETFADENRRQRFMPAAEETRFFAFLDLLHANDSQRVLDFFASLGGEEQIYDFFADHGQILMRQYPRETTEVLKCIYDDRQLINTSQLITSPERLMPLLMTNNECCVNFVEHITCCRRGGQCVKWVFNFLFELYLRAWQRGNKPTEELLEFMRLNEAQLCAVHVFILSRTYAFWVGIVHMYELSAQHHLSMRHFVKSGDFSKAFDCRGDIGRLSLPNLWIQALNKRSKTQRNKVDSSKSDNSVSLINQLLSVSLQRKRQSLMQLLQSISADKSLCVLHIKDFFEQSQLQQIVGTSPRHQIDIFEKLHVDIQHLNRLLESFNSNPIEFRSSICDICRRQLKLPAVYFLCQHSYHKECIKDYTTNDNECIACVSQEKHKTAFAHQQLLVDEEDSKETNLNNITLSSNDDIIEIIGSFLGHGIFNRFEYTSSTVYLETPRTITTTQTKNLTSTNPFEEYDANLNPFSEDLNPFEND